MPVVWENGKKKYYADKGSSLGGNTTSYKSVNKKYVPQKGSPGLSLSRGSLYRFPEKHNKPVARSSRGRYSMWHHLARRSRRW